jgi:26S proteasome regulatory subunit N9
MSVSFDLKGSDWAAEKQQNCAGNEAEYWSKLELLSKKKLWHQLTLVVLDILHNSRLSISALDLYTNFVSEFEIKFNKLSLMEVIIKAVNDIKDPKEAHEFLNKFKPKVSECSMSSILLKIVSGAIYLKNERKEAKRIIEEVEKELDGLGIVKPVHSRFYELSSEYYQIEGDHGEYYRNSLMYLGVTDLSKFDKADRKAKAFSLGISALLATNVYNMGELLQHEILTSLKSTEDEWLINLLEAFNCGDINTFKQTQAKWSQQPDLKNHSKSLTEKMCLMCLMEMTFVRPPNDRAITFDEIAQKTNLNKSEVELLVMRALSLKLVKGVIDEVSERVHMTWVQPRVLNTEQIGRMRDRLSCWVKEVAETESLIEENARPILTC